MLQFIVLVSGVLKCAKTKMKQNGFTLMEILIVIAMLGILATVIFGSYLSSIKRARDNRRKQDLQQVSRALELYYAENNNYPNSLNWGSSLSDPDDAAKFYMKKLPIDPSGTDNGYNYFYEALNNGQSYGLYSCLENEEDPDYQVYNKDCGATCNSQCYYAVSSPDIEL